jgi:hypothetical protein
MKLWGRKIQDLSRPARYVQCKLRVLPHRSGAVASVATILLLASMCVAPKRFLIFTVFLLNGLGSRCLLRCAASHWPKYPLSLRNELSGFTN